MGNKEVHTPRIDNLENNVELGIVGNTEEEQCKTQGWGHGQAWKDSLQRYVLIYGARIGTLFFYV